MYCIIYLFSQLVVFLISQLVGFSNIIKYNKLVAVRTEEIVNNILIVKMMFDLAGCNIRITSEFSVCTTSNVCCNGCHTL